MKIETRPINKLKKYDSNSRTHSAEQVAQIAKSIKEYGFTNPLLIDPDNVIIAGHGRLAGAQMAGLQEVPVIVLAGLTDAQRKAYVIADNKIAENAGWDDAQLQAEFKALLALDYDVTLTGFDLEAVTSIVAGPQQAPPKLSERYGAAPFSVLNAREGVWQNRKREWLSVGLRSELGRGENALGFSPGVNGSMGGKSYNEAKAAAAKTKSQSVTSTPAGLVYGKMPNFAGANRTATGTSIFDPVLTELLVNWFSAPGSRVLDPFCGGSVRGVVAGALGRHYIGVDLREEQCEANRAQWKEIKPKIQSMWNGKVVPAALDPKWMCGDSAEVLDKKMAPAGGFDMILSCPPYADLEVYSDDPRDLSTMPYDGFRKAYRQIIGKACALLAPNSFAAWVVGEVRDSDGNYYNFVGDTIQAFRDAGLQYYNEIVLVTAIGSLPIRVGKQFAASRKIGKTHQNVLIFVKGDGKKAAQRLGLPAGVEEVGDSAADPEAQEEPATEPRIAPADIGQAQHDETSRYGERL